MPEQATSERRYDHSPDKRILADTKQPVPFYVVFDKLPGHDSCKFIETETEQGEGVGPDVAGPWGPDTNETELARLGPYVRATTLTTNAQLLLEALHKCVGWLTHLSKWDGGGSPLNDAAMTEVEARAAIGRAEAIRSCYKCEGGSLGWVCESHPDKSWPDVCQCGPGMPCLDCYPNPALPDPRQ